jgi:membrane dipeptidase
MNRVVRLKERYVSALIPIFDGHNDTILPIMAGTTNLFGENETGHIDLPRAKKGGLAGGFFAVFVPNQAVQMDVNDPTASPFGSPATMPAMMTTEYAIAAAAISLGRLLQLEAESNGAAIIVRTVADLQHAIETGTFAIELHFEGAEAIDTNLHALDTWYAAGLRSLGLVWSRDNLFGSGVPFAYPSSPDTGPGLTEAGQRLVKRCNELGIMIDLSHLNEAGFWDVAKTSQHPLVATHSNAHALCASSRNLTDKQLDAIKDSQGVVGLNFNAGFLHPEGRREPELSNVSIMADHMDYLINRLGEDKVALGSDFDGAVMPSDLKDAAGLPLLMDELRTRGYDDATLRKIGFENWVRVLGLTWQ